MGFIDFTNGEVLTADQMDLVMRQGIMRFADATARDTALSAVLAEGMMCYLDDTDEVLKYDGTSWIDISGDITGVTAGTALTGGGTSGNVTLDVDESALTIAQSQVTDLTTDLASKQDDVITTQGDLVIGDASGNPVRLPVGSADQVLTSDGTTVSFQDAGGGGGLELITSGTVTSESLTVTSLPQDYKTIKAIFIGSTSTGPDIRINGVSTNTYNFAGVSSALGGVENENRPYFELLIRESSNATINLEFPFYAGSGNQSILYYAYSDSATDRTFMQARGATESTGAITEFNLLGTFTGTYEVYGEK